MEDLSKEEYDIAMKKFNSLLQFTIKPIENFETPKRGKLKSTELPKEKTTKLSNN